MGRERYGLTGLEQYSVERAGYFIRRGAIDHELIIAAREACDAFAASDTAASLAGEKCAEQCALIGDLQPVRAIAQDLLGSAALSRTVICLSPDTRHVDWKRGFPLDHSLPAADQAALLHGRRPEFEFCIPLSVHTSLLVCPGSHEQPLTLEQSALLLHDEHAVLPGSVRLKIGAGDLLIMSEGLLRRLDPLHVSPSHTVHYTFARKL